MINRSWILSNPPQEWGTGPVGQGAHKTYKQDASILALQEILKGLITKKEVSNARREERKRGEKEE
jgi:hypothetical protein